MRANIASVVLLSSLVTAAPVAHPIASPYEQINNYALSTTAAQDAQTLGLLWPVLKAVLCKKAALLGL